jgi:hypothetical protein
MNRMKGVIVISTKIANHGRMLSVMWYGARQRIPQCRRERHWGVRCQRTPCHTHAARATRAPALARRRPSLWGGQHSLAPGATNLARRVRGRAARVIRETE